jgi:hypothetical protein
MTDDRVTRRIRAANPVQIMPTHDAELMKSILATPGDARLTATSTPPRGTRHSWHYVVPASGLVAVAAAAIAVVPIPGGPAVSPTSAVARVLSRAAVAAQHQPMLRLGRGQYLYSESIAGGGPVGFYGCRAPKHVRAVSPDTVELVRIQTWEGADASGRILRTAIGPQFYSSPGRLSLDPPFDRGAGVVAG